MKRDIKVAFEGAISENCDRCWGPVLFERFIEPCAIW
jgi:hypothetical protein